MTTVLKLGGSVITEKSEPETVDEKALGAAVTAISNADASNLVLVHGGGSFGHHHASRYGVTTTAGSDDAAAARDVHAAMKRLNDAVVGRLADAGVRAVPVHPFAAGYRDGDGDLDLPTGQVSAVLGEGFVPVLHGDVVTHEGRGVTILSGDEIVVALAEALDATGVGLCSTVPGVLDGDGDVVPEIASYDDVADVLGGSDATDVTGGMAAKVRALLELDAPASVFGPDDLGAFLAGDEPGTLIRGRNGT
jgi:isopentenyl phosphate kinase